MSSVAVKVLSTVNAPYGTAVTAEELAAKISDPVSVENCDASAFSFYSEVSADLQLQFLDEMGIDHTVAAEIAEKFSQLAGYPMALTSAIKDGRAAPLALGAIPATSCFGK